MNKDEIAAIYGKLQHLIKQYEEIKADVSFFSTEVTNPQSFHNLNTLKKAFNHIKSTGGTDFRCIFRGLDTYYKHDRPILLVIITDGYGKFPDSNKHQVNVIWGMTSNDVKAPFGETIHLKGGNQ
jgi:predicted metal-dependent peptidase